MGYVHPDKPDIFLSYARVNDDPDATFPDRPGWVTTLVRGLKQRLANKFGRGEYFELWSRRAARRPCGTDPGDPRPTPRRRRDRPGPVPCLSGVGVVPSRVSGVPSGDPQAQGGRGSRSSSSSSTRSSRARGSPSWPISRVTASGSRTATPATPRPSATRSFVRRTRSTTGGTTTCPSSLSASSRRCGRASRRPRLRSSRRPRTPARRSTSPR